MRLGLALLLTISAAGCGDDTSNAADMATQDLSMPGQDLTPAPDLTPAGDMTVNKILFGPAVSYAAGNGPLYVAIGDTRKNGKRDVVVANFGAPPATDGNVTVSLGNGDGTFQNAVGYSLGTGTNPLSVAIGDVDNDNKPDLVVGLNGSNFAVLYGNGDGTFVTPAVTFASNVSKAQYVALGNIAQGKATASLDVVIADSTTDTVSVVVGAGARVSNFSATSHTFSTGPAPSGVVIDDFNQDTKPDVATINLTDSTITVLLNTGTSGTPVSFGIASSYQGGAGADGIASAKINGDAYPDLITANANDNTVSVLTNKANGTFNTKVDHAVGPVPAAVAVADFDSDGMLDLVCADSGDNTVSVVFGESGGNFSVPKSFPVGSAPSSLATGLLNADTKPDVAVGNNMSNDISILLNTLP
jgi:hypothetical protein